MAKRPVPAQELAAVASRFNGTPVDNNPRAFKFPDAAASDAWNKSVDRLEAGETLDAVLGNKPSSSTTGAAPLDAAVGFVGGLMHQVLDPAVDASRALLPGGWGVEAAAERLAGDKQALTNSDIYKKATYIPDTTAGTLGSYLPVLAGTALGVATEGAIPTLATLGGAVGAQKASEATAEYIAGQPTFNLTPEQIESWRRLAGTAGMVAGGAAAHKMTPKVTIPEAVEAVKQSRQALVDSAKQRTAGATLGGIKGYKLGGYPAAAAGSVAGAISPEAAASASKASVIDALTRVASGGKEPTPRPEPTPALKPSFFDQNVAVIAKADEIASRNPTVDTTTPTQQKEILKTLQGGLEAHKANKTTPSDELVRLHDEFAAATTARKAAVVQQQAGRELARQQNAINSLIEDYQSISNEAGIDWQLRNDTQLKADIKKAQDYVAAHIEAGEQPPADLVTILDAARNELITRKSQISLAAHDEAMRSLVASATEGSQAYDAALAKLPVKTRKMLQDLEGETLNILRTRSRNAGDRLKPTDDPWFKLVNDITSEPATSVEVPVESPGGSATWSTNVDVVRKPGAAVSIDVSPENRGGTLVRPQASPSLEQSSANAVQAAGRPESVVVPPSSPSGSATVPSGLDVVRVPGAAVSVPAQAAAPASASATTPATASAPAQTAAPVSANSAVATRAAKRGSTLFQARPRTGYDPVALADARQLQEMSRVYEQHEGLISPNGPIDEAFIARFKNLAYKFLGGDTRQKYTFKTKKTTPSLSTLNGAINQRYKYAPPVVRESLGLPRAPKVKD